MALIQCQWATGLWCRAKVNQTYRNRVGMEGDLSFAGLFPIPPGGSPGGTSESLVPPGLMLLQCPKEHALVEYSRAVYFFLSAAALFSGFGPRRSETSWSLPSSPS